MRPDSSISRRPCGAKCGSRAVRKQSGTEAELCGSRAARKQSGAEAERHGSRAVRKQSGAEAEWYGGRAAWKQSGAEAERHGSRAARKQSGTAARSTFRGPGRGDGSWLCADLTLNWAQGQCVTARARLCRGQDCSHHSPRRCSASGARVQEAHAPRDHTYTHTHTECTHTHNTHTRSAHAHTHTHGVHMRAHTHTRAIIHTHTECTCVHKGRPCLTRPSIRFSIAANLSSMDLLLIEELFDTRGSGSLVSLLYESRIRFCNFFNRKGCGISTFYHFRDIKESWLRIIGFYFPAIWQNLPHVHSQIITVFLDLFRFLSTDRTHIESYTASHR